MSSNEWPPYHSEYFCLVKMFSHCLLSSISFADIWFSCNVCLVTAVQFGIALPAWIVEKRTSFWVLVLALL